MQFQTTGDHRILSDKCCVLFEADTGAIHHVHRVITYVGVEEKTQADMEAAARSLMRKTDRQVRSLFVEATAMALRGNYSVEPAGSKLVRTELAPPAH